MKRALVPSQKLFEKILSDEQRKHVIKILSKVKDNQGDNPNLYLWEVDQTIGGVGGYCMPNDPKRNPFPGGVERELFRPLQYARADIDLGLISTHGRYIVMNSGMHLEAVIRLVLKNERFLGSIRYQNHTLGKATHVLKKMDIATNKLIDGLFVFVKLYNQSKHDVNQDENRERMFSESDALISYLAARIIGVELLKLIKHDSLTYAYKIKHNVLVKRNYSKNILWFLEMKEEILLYK